MSNPNWHVTDAFDAALYEVVAGQHENTQRTFLSELMARPIGRLLLRALIEEFLECLPAYQHRAEALKESLTFPLGGLLSERAGWRYEVDGDVWCYGERGAGRIVVSITDLGISAYMHEFDVNEIKYDPSVECNPTFSSIQDFEAWLSPFEEELRGLTDLQICLLEDLRRRGVEPSE